MRLPLPSFAEVSAIEKVRSLTRTWVIELDEIGITVDAAAHSPVETGMFRRNTPVGSEAEGRFLSMTPMRRLGSLPVQRLGHVDEIAAAIVFAAIGKSHFMTCHSISVDGGFTA
jgi:3-oxoacyl-[acyl-carrier protein] reductase